MSGIYRKKAIDRLSSPEQLDRMVPIASSSTWMLIIAVGIITVACLTWAFGGSITESYYAVGFFDPVIEEVSQQVEGKTAVCFVPQSYISYVSVGMRVNVKTHVGSVGAVIKHIDSAIASQYSMNEILGNSDLIYYLPSNEPVIAVYCTIEELPIGLINGSMVQVEIPISNKKPIQYVMP